MLWVRDDWGVPPRFVLDQRVGNVICVLLCGVISRSAARVLLGRGGAGSSLPQGCQPHAMREEPGSVPSLGITRYLCCFAWLLWIRLAQGDFAALAEPAHAFVCFSGSAGIPVGNSDFLSLRSMLLLLPHCPCSSSSSRFCVMSCRVIPDWSQRCCRHSGMTMR